ncbi:MAG: hypothetical protein KDA41_19270 [Planctomycetales bacterium]|nr:hypothetical protein [Planctomycetales bacterium]
MRHLVNFGLLLSFATLAATGATAFWLPFRVSTTRVHVVFGLATALLVALHVAARWPYFRSRLFPTSRVSPSRLMLVALAAVWLLLLATAYWGWAPARLVISQAYEARHRAEIVRASPLAGFGQLAPREQLVARAPADGADVSLSLFVRFQEHVKTPPAIAVWAESSTGAMIETLYLDPRLAYAEKPNWGGAATPRSHILPIWRHRYTLVSGVDPNGQIDALTQATPTHSFSLDNYLTLGEGKEFILCVEVNAPGDPNEAYDDAVVGQPSLLYTAYIEIDSPQPYALLELTGHGGGAETSGAIQYDLDQITSARQLVDLLLAKTQAITAPQAAP